MFFEFFLTKNQKKVPQQEEGVSTGNLAQVRSNRFFKYLKSWSFKLFEPFSTEKQEKTEPFSEFLYLDQLGIKHDEEEEDLFLRSALQQQQDSDVPEPPTPLTSIQVQTTQRDHVESE